jgi:hypothetical protein
MVTRCNTGNNKMKKNREKKNKGNEDDKKRREFQYLLNANRLR